MKLAIMSDLHNEFDRRGRRCDLSGLDPEHPQFGPDLSPLRGQVDVLALAGDIDVGRDAVRYCAAAAAYLGIPVVMVAGNHEYYNGVQSQILGALRAEAALHKNVYVLENAAVELDFASCTGHWNQTDHANDTGSAAPAEHTSLANLSSATSQRGRLRILGCSLWTNYALYGDGDGPIAAAMAQAQEGMSDHWVIKLDSDGNAFTPAHALAQHQRSVMWLREASAQEFAGATIIMTHHGVSARSQPPQFAGSALGPCFVSNLDELVNAADVPLWVHGHTHYDVDYQIGRTRIVARQRGYPGENERFEPLIITL